MKASSVSGLSITRRPVATAFLKVTANDDCTNTIVRTARLLIDFGRAALSNALAAHLTSPALGLLRRRIAISVHLCWWRWQSCLWRKLTFCAEQSFPFSPVRL